MEVLPVGSTHGPLELQRHNVLIGENGLHFGEFAEVDGLSYAHEAFVEVGEEHGPKQDVLKAVREGLIADEHHRDHHHYHVKEAIQAVYYWLVLELIVIDPPASKY